MQTIRLVLGTLAVMLAASGVIDAQSRDQPATVTFTIEGMT